MKSLHFVPSHELQRQGASCVGLSPPPPGRPAAISRAAATACATRSASRQRRTFAHGDPGYSPRPSLLARATGPTRGDAAEPAELSSALEAARKNLAEGTSPGAGLSSEESAEAAYADLINTSLGDGQELTAEEALELSQAGNMEGTAKQQKSRGLLGDVAQLLGALKGGAHIVRRDDGSI